MHGQPPPGGPTLEIHLENSRLYYYAYCKDELYPISETRFITSAEVKYFDFVKDDLMVRDIEQKFLPHPLAPFLTALGMTRRTESPCLAGEHQQPLFPAVGTPDAGKPAHRIAAVEVLLDNILDDRPEIPVLFLETILIFSKEPLKIIKKYTIKNRVFRITLSVDPCYSRDVYSKIRPESGTDRNMLNFPLYSAAFRIKLKPK